MTAVALAAASAPYAAPRRHISQSSLSIQHTHTHTHTGMHRIDGANAFRGAKMRH